MMLGVSSCAHEKHSDFWAIIRAQFGFSFPQKPLRLQIFQGTVEDWQGEIRGCGFPPGFRTFLICLCCGRAKVSCVSFRNKSIMATGGVK